jgi:hypothetical protein
MKSYLKLKNKYSKQARKYIHIFLSIQDFIIKLLSDEQESIVLAKIL